MLKKLYKYEFSWMLPSAAIGWIIVFGVALLGLVTESVYNACEDVILQSDFLTAVSSASVIALSVLLFAAQAFCVVFCIALSAVRFYKNIYSSEGYFTLCTPIKPSEHVICKAVVAFVFVLASFGVCVLSSLVRYSGVKELFETLRDIFNVFAMYEISWTYALELVIVALTASAFFISELYLAVSFGQGFKNKKLGAVVSYFIINSVVGIGQSLLSSVSSLIFGSLIFRAPNVFVHVALCGTAVLEAGLAVLAFAIVINRLKNKVNLE